MEYNPCVSIIIENNSGKILLLLRDNKSEIACPNTWTLVGGHCEEGETPQKTAERELFEEVGLRVELSLWKKIKYQYDPQILFDQYIFFGRVNTEEPKLILGEGQDMRFYSFSEMDKLHFGFNSWEIIREYYSKIKK